MQSEEGFKLEFIAMQSSALLRKKKYAPF